MSLGDGIDYHQRFGHIGEVIAETLNKLERKGGPDAFINIKYLIPSTCRHPQCIRVLHMLVPALT